ncbi:hypothetical protein IQ37_19140 [Chryseobacterium piperi]|uniref:Uncharacterized protein n=1 Tax=Chryseobacterium piperi TaxID=558152 RepID=A0A086AAJ6_9FLAO|nr:hypothetical protein [Chryseobacterium piperi]ASW75511.1 hypothetical protein CJF12_15295 [Chryseobacterium piperi]KFF13710.1 hypothetical protein IQ37_19140 [Chryseobacterium piperi]
MKNSNKKSAKFSIEKFEERKEFTFYYSIPKPWCQPQSANAPLSNPYIIYLLPSTQILTQEQAGTKYFIKKHLA